MKKFVTVITIILITITSIFAAQWVRTEGPEVILTLTETDIQIQKGKICFTSDSYILRGTWAAIVTTEEGVHTYNLVKDMDNHYLRTYEFSADFLRDIVLGCSIELRCTYKENTTSYMYNEIPSVNLDYFKGIATVVTNTTDYRFRITYQEKYNYKRITLEGEGFTFIEAKAGLTVNLEWHSNRSNADDGKAFEVELADNLTLQYAGKSNQKASYSNY